MDTGALGRLLVRRFAAMVGILIVLAAVVFALERFTPADPVHVMVGANASKETIAATKHQLGYDKPVPQQFVSYLGDLAHGDLQMSLRTRRPVTTDLGDYLPATIELAAFGMLLAGFLGVGLGLVTSLRVRGSGAVRFVLLGLASAPPFLLALIGILLFYRRLGWLPATGRTSIDNVPNGPTKMLVLDGLIHGRLDVVVDALKHLVLPAFCVAIVPAVSIGRVLRSSLVGTLRSDHVRTARAKGLRESGVVRKHALRNSIGPALSMAGLQVGLMFAGVIVVEQVFAWPGIGLYTAQSIPRTDFPAIAGVTLVLGAVYVIVNTMVDVFQAIADPRIAL
ncbi:MAG: peptide/nickel transport system permease protein [Actinomycetota bacterium]|nr:peptide/nickel transport system permease protein [Actinomycetota bacterium]